MLRLGILFVVLGFGSAIMHFTDIQFKLLMPVEDYQPYFGLGVGVLGVVLIGVEVVLKNKKKQAQAQPFAGQPAPGAPQQQPYPNQQYPQQPGQ